ncbi:hypothetical protein MesoLj131c_00370 [Mesorhizobium sp. 131-3-5]|nr:hypothetical protein MesoLj131c_00370 [Mesorhizobium sp. 131-3-5]
MLGMALAEIEHRAAKLPPGRRVVDAGGAEAGGTVDGKHFHETTGSEKHFPVPARARHRKHNLLSGFGSAGALSDRFDAQHVVVPDIARL